MDGECIGITVSGLMHKWSGGARSALTPTLLDYLCTERQSESIRFTLAPEAAHVCRDTNYSENCWCECAVLPELADEHS